MKKATLIVIIVAVLGVAAIFYLRKNDQAIQTSQPIPTSTITPTATPFGNDKINVTSPLSGQVIQSPLEVTGEAKGNWYFEASFPVQLLDGNGKIIASTPAMALSDWMTSNFVLFKATLLFDDPHTTTGTIVLKKDNPSGLPQNEDEIRLPVRFSK